MGNIKKQLQKEGKWKKLQQLAQGNPIPNTPEQNELTKRVFERANILMQNQGKTINQINNNIAPLTINKNAQRLDDGKFIKRGAFNDGYQFGDISKTIGSTLLDIPTRIVTGATKVTQDIGDFATYGIAQRSKSIGK